MPSDATSSTLPRAQSRTGFQRLFKTIADALYVIGVGDPQGCYVLNIRERIIGTLASIHRATVISPDEIPNIEFAATYDDLPTRGSDKIDWASLVVQMNLTYGSYLTMAFGLGIWSAYPAMQIRQKLIEVSKNLSWSNIKNVDHSNRNSTFLTIEALCNYMSSYKLKAHPTPVV
ncbi:hypothetical protein GQ43DRAFT_497868 [Delitschia confertaspora ATCC 74209]|uniref:Uncharacterized protein n=1 Tax=Delitschia confertaspora ATCC 74209 TaxID=1513339 RepID=A0A9P4JHT6_9PLEO|nr:hypothetical protein GQ43DRAFT_497868 [Delitschia confertaspora ATCC 74209]